MATKPKRLLRSREESVVAGVCGGLGEYFNLDPVLFRVLFIIAFLAGGSSILAYLILWIAIPERSKLEKKEE